MTAPFASVAAALIPEPALAVLAGLRARTDVTAVVSDGYAWVEGPAGDADLWPRLLAVPGATFFVRSEGRWYPLGSRLPAGHVPLMGRARPLCDLIHPAPVSPVPPVSLERSGVRLTVVRGGEPRPATGLRTTLRDLLPWAEAATTRDLAACSAARCGEAVLVRGERLPAVPGPERFHGVRVWVPLGCRAEPELPEDVLREAAGVAADELLILTEAGAEAVPESAFRPLTRAGVRLATGAD